MIASERQPTAGPGAVQRADPWQPWREHDTVLVVNFGGQYAHMISRRVRELGVYSELVEPGKLKATVEEKKPKAIILSGGPESVYAPGAPHLEGWVPEPDMPVLGICYGFQLITQALGGNVERGRGEYGRTKILVEAEGDPIFEGWGKVEYAWMSHGDHVSTAPPGAVALATSENGYPAAIRVDAMPRRGGGQSTASEVENLERKEGSKVPGKVYGVQFHPEVTHTAKGKLLISNFLFKVARVRPTWGGEDVISRAVEEIRAKVRPGEKVFCAVSGGVDSTVAALITKAAVGDSLMTVLVDHGFLREGEAQQALEALKRVGLSPSLVDAREKFASKLKGVSDPEEKRKAVGETFAEVFEQFFSEDKALRWFVQGTTYPDVVESGAVEGSHKIKSHHNVGGLPRWFSDDVGVLEPLRYLYKDEVRRLAKLLGAHEFADKHPFPGPGLAVRVIGEVTEAKLGVVRRASAIVEEELRLAKVYDRVWQAFAVVGDDRWVGVRGDQRHEGYVVTVRVVESEDGMTADWARLPPELLERISKRIYEEVPEVGMVTYAVTPKPPSTIEPCRIHT